MPTTVHFSDCFRGAGPLGCNNCLLLYWSEVVLRSFGQTPTDFLSGDWSCGGEADIILAVSNKQYHLHEHMTDALTQGPKPWKSLCLVECFLIYILKLWTTLNSLRNPAWPWTHRDQPCPATFLLYTGSPSLCSTRANILFIRFLENTYLIISKT